MPDTTANTPMPSPLEELLARLRTDWAAGRATTVEEALAKNPAPDIESEALMDLIYQEMLLREEHGPKPSLAEYQQRFPALSDELRRQFEVLGLINEVTVSRVPQRTSPASATFSVAPFAAPALPVIPGLSFLRVLGRGGMGTVHLARQHALERLVAVKLLDAAQLRDPRQRERFLREARLAARLKHPHLLPVLEVGEVGDEPYLVMEYCEGGNLAEALKGQPLTAADLVAIGISLAEAVAAAHAEGIVHRDLKPANILIAQPLPPAPQPWSQILLKIGDFGLAYSPESPGLTETGAMLGTPSYMAPEQVQGGPTASTPAVDVYALGAVLYELATGRPPFRASSAFATLDEVRTRDPARPRSLVAALPLDIETIILKCLRKEPADRYISAQKLAEDLKRFQSGKPIQARPVPMTERVWKWSRRQPAAAAALALGLGLAALVVVLLFVQTSRLQAQAELVKSERLRAEQATAARAAALRYAKQTERLLQDLSPDSLADASVEERLRYALRRFVATHVEEPLSDPDLLAGFVPVAGQALEAIGEYALAQKLLEELLPRLIAARGASDPAALRSQLHLGRVCCKTGNPQLGRRLLAKGLALAHAQDPLWKEYLTRAFLGDLAQADGQAGQLNSAIDILEKLRRLEQDAAVGALTKSFTLNSLGWFYVQNRQYDQAILRLTEAFAVREWLLGSTHPTTMATTNNLAIAYQNSGQLTKALPLFEWIAPAMRRKYGLTHHLTLTFLFNRCQALLLAGPTPQCFQAINELTLLLPSISPEGVLEVCKLLEVTSRIWSKAGQSQPAEQLLAARVLLLEGKLNELRQIRESMKGAPTPAAAQQFEQVANVLTKFLEPLTELAFVYFGGWGRLRFFLGCQVKEDRHGQAVAVG